jgi:hypothetical protein
MTPEPRKLSCGCDPATADYRIVNRSNHSVRVEPDDQHAVTICTGCGNEVEL